MAVDEFLAWATAQPKGRFELSQGQVVAMAPEKADHTRAKLAAVMALAGAVRQAGLPCEAFVDGLTVVIDDETVYEPEALVDCGPRIAGDAVVAKNPIIVVEVLSPSTGHIDRAVKAADYLRVPSIAHVLIVDVVRKAVHHYRRAAEGKAEVSILREGTIELGPPGMAVAVRELLP